jgi:hypothetical protein
MTPTSLFGVLFLLVGLLGFVSNPLIGADALFATDGLHNVLHILLGLFLLGVDRWSKATTVYWLKIVGALLFLLGIIGLLTVSATGGMLLGLTYANGGLNWFNTVVGGVMFALAL